MAVAMTGGDVLLQHARPELLQAALDVVGQAVARLRRPTKEFASLATVRGLRRSRLRPRHFRAFRLICRLS